MKSLLTILLCAAGVLAHAQHKEVTNIKQGKWSDKTIWSNQRLPDSNTCVTLVFNTVIDTNAHICCLKVDSSAKLNFADKNILLQLEKAMVVEGQLIAKPDAGKNIIEFLHINESSFVGGMPMDDEPDMLDNGLYVLDNGKLDLHGKTKKPWTNIKTDVAIGATNITVKDATGWQIGDEIVVAPTDNADQSGINYNDQTGEIIDPYVNHFERRIITQINGSTIYFTEPLKYIHSTVNSTITSNLYGTSSRAWTAEVANLTRNIVIRGTTTGRAHIMVMSGVAQSIIQVEGTLLGPRKMQGGRRPEVILGRYGLHFHMCGDGTQGTVVRGCSFHDIGSHVFVPHMSNGVTLRNNVAFNSLETPFWYDPNSPTHDLTWDHNLAMAARWNGTNAPSGFFLGQGDNTNCSNNVAVYCQSGDGHAAGSFAWDANNESPLGWIFKHNLAHSCGTGIWTWQNTDNQHIVEDFDTYNTAEPIVAGAYGNRYVYVGGHHYGGKLYIEASGVQFHNIYIDAKGADYIGSVTPSPINAGNEYPNRFTQCVFANYKRQAMEVANNGNISTYKYLDLILCEFNKGNGFEFRDDDYYVLSNGTRVRVQKSQVSSYQQIRQPGLQGSTSIKAFAPDYYGKGDGLVCDYFNNTTLSGTPVFTKIEREVRFHQATINNGNMPNGIDHKIDNEHYSVRRTGSLEPQYSSAYTFVLNTGMGCRLWLNDSLIVDRWNGLKTATSKPINLVKGQRYNLKLETYIDGPPQVLDLSWKCPEMEYEQTVPFTQLYQQQVSTARVSSAKMIAAPVPATNKMSVSPNPATTSATIYLPQQYQSGYILLSDGKGNVLKRIAVNSNTIPVDVSALTAGIYYYSLYAEDKLISTVKLLKQ